MGLALQARAPERRASVENPSTSLSNPDAWLVDLLGGGDTASGVNVSQKTALQFSAVWACVNVLSQDVAKLPLFTYRRLPRGKELAAEHPIYRVLKKRANPHMTAFNFRRTLQAHVVTWGKAFAEIERNNRGDVVALWPLLPDRTEAERVGGKKVVVTQVGTKDIVLDAANVLHIPGLGFDGLRSYSVISMARQAIGAGIAAERFGAAFFGNGARPGGVIMRPDSLTPEARQRLRQGWERMHGGLTNQQRVAILDEGMKYESVGIPPEDAQFISTRQFAVEEIARWFRVPPHKIQHLLRSTYSNVENEERSYVHDALQSWLVAWEQEIDVTLFDEREQSEFFVQHSVDALLRGDSLARKDFYQSGITNGWLSINDVRAYENLNPVDGGDIHLVPLNLIPLDQADQLALPGEPMDDAAMDDDARAATDRRRSLAGRRSLEERHRVQASHMTSIARVAERVIADERARVEVLVEKTLVRARADFTADLGKLYERFEEVVQQAFGALLVSYGDVVRTIVAGELGTATDPDPDYRAFVERYAASFARRYVRKSRSQLEAVVMAEPPETQADAVRARLDAWGETRAAKIGHVESVRAMGAFSKAAYIGAGVLALVWRAIGANCPFCRRLNGRVVGTRENFASKGDTIAPDGDDDAEPMAVNASCGHPPLHRGCDCLIGPSF